MALNRASGSGGVIESTAEPTSFTAFTICGYCLVNSDTNTPGALRQIIAALIDTDGVDAPVFIDWDQEGLGVMIIGSYAPPDYDESVFASRPSVGEWFHFYVRCSATGADQLECGWARVTDAAYVTASADMFTTGGLTPKLVHFGSYSFADTDSDMRFAYLRAWNSKLTDNEIALERWSSRASKLPVVFDVPADGPTTTLAVIDYSATLANLTLASITVVADNPPVTDLLDEEDARQTVSSSGVINVVTLEDSLILSEALLWSVLRIRFQLDAALLLDEGTQTAYKTLLASEALTLADELIRVYRRVIVAEDSMLLVDDLISITSGIRIVTAVLSSLVILFDELQAYANRLREAGSSVIMDDSLSVSALRNRELLDSALLMDDFIRRVNLTRVLDDNLTLFDDLVALVSSIVTADGSRIEIGADLPNILLGADRQRIDLGATCPLILLGGERL